MKTRLVVVGGVAGGATAAARARRLSEDAEITVLERGPYVSYANCGLPYFISGEIESRAELLLQTPEGFDARYGVKVHVNTEVVKIDRAGKRVLARSGDGETWYPYDKLILAQGGTPITPAIPGVDARHVFKLWTVPDTDRLDAFLSTEKPRSAVVMGGGFIGLEMAEALRKRGLETTVVELAPTVLSIMDHAVGTLVTRELESHGVKVLAGVAVKAVLEKTVLLTDGRVIPAELVMLSVGVKPELTLARDAGLELGASGGLRVNEYLQTSDANIYAAGDMVEVVHKVSGKKVRIPLAGPANRQGRIAASNALGMEMKYGGSLGTSVVKVFEATAAMTGLSQRAARDAGFKVGVAVIHKAHHASYYPGAHELTLTLVYDRRNARLLGAQAFGHGGVEKRMDVLATALHGNMTLHDLAQLDLSYAPPFSSANDPINLAAFIGLNDLSGFSPIVTAEEFNAELHSAHPPLVLDVRSLGEFEPSHVKGAMHLPVDDVRFELARLPRDRRILVHCRSGFRGHLAVRVLKDNGFQDVANVTGGYLSMQLQGGFPEEKV